MRGEKKAMGTLRQMASERDMQFLKDIIFKKDTPEYNGYNTRFLGIA